MRMSGSLTKGWRSVRAMVLVALLPAAAAAQAGRISGTVMDSTKAPLVGAQIGVVGTRLSAVTDATGKFTITGLNAGTYEVRVQDGRIAVRAA